MSSVSPTHMLSFLHFTSRSPLVNFAQEIGQNPNSVLIFLWISVYALIPWLHTFHQRLSRNMAPSVVETTRHFHFRPVQFTQISENFYPRARIRRVPWQFHASRLRQGGWGKKKPVEQSRDGIFGQSELLMDFGSPHNRCYTGDQVFSEAHDTENPPEAGRTKITPPMRLGCSEKFRLWQEATHLLQFDRVRSILMLRFFRVCWRYCLIFDKIIKYANSICQNVGDILLDMLVTFFKKKKYCVFREIRASLYRMPGRVSHHTARQLNVGESSCAAEQSCSWKESSCAETDERLGVRLYRMTAEHVYCPVQKLPGATHFGWGRESAAHKGRWRCWDFSLHFLFDPIQFTKHQIFHFTFCGMELRDQVVGSGPAQQAMLSEGSDPANPPYQPFELNL